MTLAISLPVVEARCWQKIGVWGDRSCPELERVTHCHNCPVFAAAGRHFLDAPSPAGYLEEWTARLASLPEGDAGAMFGALVFRLADEWLAFPVESLIEVTHVRPVHRVPHRGGVVAGLVNIRGELHLCGRLELLLGTTLPTDAANGRRRMIVVRSEDESWVFAVDEVEQVRRIPSAELKPPAPTLIRAAARLTRGVIAIEGRAIGLLDVPRVFQTLRERLR